MKYGISHWIVKPGNRYSISYYSPQVKDYINDSIYTEESIFDWTCIKYIFKHEDNLVIPENIITWLWVEYMDIEQAREYMRTNTNLEEVETWKFLLTPEYTMSETIYPANSIIINGD